MDCGVKSREVELGVLVTLKNTELVKTISTIANTNHVGHFEIFFYSITFFLLAMSFILFCFIMEKLQDARGLRGAVGGVNSDRHACCVGFHQRLGMWDFLSLPLSSTVQCIW